MKWKSIAYILLVIGILTAFLAHSRNETVPVIDNSVFDNPQRTAAVFDHDDHNEKAGLEYDCAFCHHVYDGDKLVEGESSEDYYCSDCHYLEKAPDNTVSLREAFHIRCRSCHFETNKGPVLCGECHKK